VNLRRKVQPAIQAVCEVEEKEHVSLSDLALLTGLTPDLLKKELIVSEDELSLRDLRKTVLEYLDTTFATIS